MCRSDSSDWLPMSVWYKRVFAAGFLFFLIKGLVWLAIALSVVLWSM